MFTDDVSLLGDDFPFTARAQVDVRDAGAFYDGRAQIGRSLGHRVAGARGVDVAVIQR